MMSQISQALQHWDFSVLDAIQQSMRSPLTDRLMVFVTRLSDNGFIWIVIAVVLLCVKTYRRGGFTLALALLIDMAGVNLLLKNIFCRPRPCDIAPMTDMLINRPSGWSFPSGHTAVSFTAAMVLFTINKKWGACAFVLAALTGFTRLYLYVHFPTDVIFGVLFGILFGWMGVALARWLERKRRV